MKTIGTYATNNNKRQFKNTYNDNDKCNKCSTFQIESWFDELCENEEGVTYGQSKEPRPKILLKTCMKVV
jgi:hypothetical protein